MEWMMALEKTCFECLISIKIYQKYEVKNILMVNPVEIGNYLQTIPTKEVARKY